MSWKKDKFDHRDFIHGKHTPKAAKIPNTFSLEEYLPDVRDQGQVGSCTGFGIGGILTGLAKQLDVYTEWFSPEWIYNGARYIEGTLSQDAGAEPGDCMAWLSKMGCLLEEYWPYDPTRVDTTSPPSKDNSLAAKFPIMKYVRVTGGSAGICDALAAGNFVTIGTPWFETWMDVGSDGVLPSVNRRTPVAGGHETFLYGYNKSKKVFYGQNSWSSEWGNQGRYEMPFGCFDKDFSRFGGYDAYYVTASWSSTPIPVPVANYTITSTIIDNGGTITPYGNTILDSGSNQTFTITASDNYQIDYVVVDGVDQGPISTYTFVDVVKNHAISVSFKAITPAPVPTETKYRLQTSVDNGKTWTTVYNS
jgi:Papain family cysteine protease